MVLLYAYKACEVEFTYNVYFGWYFKKPVMIEIVGDDDEL